MKYWLAAFLIIGLSMTASAGVDIVGKIGGGHNFGFTGRFPLTGGIGSGSSPPPASCDGTIDLSTGCVMPMLR